MFGEYLVQIGKITNDDLQKALSLLRYHKRKIGRILFELGLLTQKELDFYLIEYLKPFNQFCFEELKLKIDLIQMNQKDKDLCFSHYTIPIDYNPQSMTLLVDSFSDHKMQYFEKIFNRKILFLIAENELIEILSKKTISKNKSKLIVSEKVSDDEKLQLIDPFTKILKSCFEHAKKMKASDIHFEPYQKEYLIRFRVFGVLVDWKVLEAQHARSITTALKYITNMDLAIIGRPQDSRATLMELGIDIRASSMPVTSGDEKIVLRLQYHGEAINIRSLGLSTETLNVLLDGINKKDGLILISGPTGSGKTTTLYSLLEEMDRLGKNISTLENPVEKRLARINQANVNDHKDFDSFQRALMRQDPDVILLGEIRDAQTADLSLKLASTGHLVLSTIHANGAVEVIDRLTNLGADCFSIKSNLRLSIAQRLIQKICSHCSIPVNDIYRRVNLQGCEHCHSGVVGRVAIIEYLDSKDLKELKEFGTEQLKVRISLNDECIRLAALGQIDCIHAEGI